MIRPDDGLSYPFADPPGRGEATEVAPGILWLRLPLPMALDHVNTFALDEGDGWTLIDTGIDTPDCRGAWDMLLSGPLAGRQVRRVLVTHHHPDHVGLAGMFVAGGAELLMPRTGWLTTRMLCLDAQDRPSHAALTLMRLAGTTTDEVARRAEERPFNMADLVAPLPPTYTRIADGDVLRLGGRDWRVRMGEGHAPEHATLWSDGLVLAGDQVLPGISPNLGVWPSEPAADPVGAFLTSCAALAVNADPADLILPGHKRPFRGMPARLAALIAHHHAALDRLQAALDTPRTALACMAPLFGRVIGGTEAGLALAETLAHLNHLQAKGRAFRHVGADGAWVWQARP